MTALDIIVLLLVGGGALFGFMKGFVSEALSLVAWVFAILAVKLFHTPFTQMLAGSVGTGSGALVLAFVLLFGVTFIVTRLVARSVGAKTRTSILGPFDRFLGVGFGALKGLIGSTLIFLLATLASDTAYGGAANRPKWIRDARTYPLLNATSRAMVDYIDRRRNAAPEPEDKA